MTIDIITLFPTMFTGPFDESIIKRAQDENAVAINLHNLRDWAIDKRGTVDDKPYGGGKGMLLRPEPLFSAVDSIRDTKFEIQNTKILLLDAGGEQYSQHKARDYSKLDQLIVICGHYEGVDYRVHEYLADDIISIGPYVLTGGEIPAMTIIDSVVRLLPGVLDPEATAIESHMSNEQRTNNNDPYIEFPQYTRPEVYKGWRVPDVLRSGNHAEIEKWQHNAAKKRSTSLRLKAESDPE